MSFGFLFMSLSTGGVVFKNTINTKKGVFSDETVFFSNKNYCLSKEMRDGCLGKRKSA